MDKIDEILLEFGINPKDVATYQEPQHSKEIILACENKYGLNTGVVFDGNELYKSTIPKKVYDIWFEAYCDFIIFDGDEDEINTIGNK